MHGCPPDVPTCEADSALTASDRCLFRANSVDAPKAVALFDDTFRVFEEYPSLGPRRPMAASVLGAMARVRCARGVSRRRVPGWDKWGIFGVGAARARGAFPGSLCSLPGPWRGPLGSVVRNLVAQVKVAVRRSVPRREAGAPRRKCRDTDGVMRDRARRGTDEEAKAAVVTELEVAKRNGDPLSHHEKLEDSDAGTPLTGDLFGDELEK